MTRPPKDSLRDAFVAAIPHLRAFAVSLCHDAHLAALLQVSEPEGYGPDAYASLVARLPIEHRPP